MALSFSHYISYREHKEKLENLLNVLRLIVYILAEYRLGAINIVRSQ